MLELDVDARLDFSHTAIRSIFSNCLICFIKIWTCIGLLLIIMKHVEPLTAY